MKNIHKITIILTSLFLVNCSNDDSGSVDRNPDPVQENRSPSDFGLVSILDLSSEVDLFPTFEWEMATDPDGDDLTYDVFLGKTMNPQTLVASDLEEATFQVTARLERNTQYYWRVVAKDGNGGLGDSDIFTFETRGLDTPIAPLTSQAEFSPRIGSTEMAVEFQGQLWVIGGTDENGDSNEIWVSNSGQDWVLLDNVPFSARRGYTLTAFNDKLWVIGGVNKDNMFTSEIWFTENGTDWDFALSTVAVRRAHSTIVFDDKLWIYGGLTESGYSDDIAVSADGLNWANPISLQRFSPRAFHKTAVLNDNLYLIGGLVNNSEIQKVNDVWISSDGATWAKVTDFKMPLQERGFYDVVSLDNSLWLLGGREQGSIPGVDDVYYNDIWVSRDGNLWSKFTDDGKFAPRALHEVVVFDGNLLLIGGTEGLDRFLNDVWKLE